VHSSERCNTSYVDEVNNWTIASFGVRKIKCSAGQLLRASTTSPRRSAVWTHKSFLREPTGVEGRSCFRWRPAPRASVGCITRCRYCGRSRYSGRDSSSGKSITGRELICSGDQRAGWSASSTHRRPTRRWWPICEVGPRQWLFGAAFSGAGQHTICDWRVAVGPPGKSSTDCAADPGAIARTDSPAVGLPAIKSRSSKPPYRSKNPPRVAAGRGPPSCCQMPNVLDTGTSGVPIDITPDRQGAATTP